MSEYNHEERIERLESQVGKLVNVVVGFQSIIQSAAKLDLALLEGLRTGHDFNMAILRALTESQAFTSAEDRQGLLDIISRAESHSDKLAKDIADMKKINPGELPPPPPG